MLTHPVVCVLIGTLLGFLSGLGVGGGSLLMLWLTAVLGFTHQYSRAMNLMFFIPSALVASCFRFRSGKMPWHILLTAMIAGCAGSVLGNLISSQLDLEWMKKIFGIFFILSGIRELFYRPRKLR